jgi:hypothetical protein
MDCVEGLNCEGIKGIKGWSVVAVAGSWGLGFKVPGLGFGEPDFGLEIGFGGVKYWL